MQRRIKRNKNGVQPLETIEVLDTDDYVNKLSAHFQKLQMRAQVFSNQVNKIPELVDEANDSSDDEVDADLIRHVELMVETLENILLDWERFSALRQPGGLSEVDALLDELYIDFFDTTDHFVNEFERLLEEPGKFSKSNQRYQLGTFSFFDTDKVDEFVKYLIKM